MKILFMADVPPDKDSGAAGTEYQTIKAIRALGHEVDTVWADALPHRISHGNLHYLVELPFAYRRHAIKGLGKEHYDVIHVNQPHGYLAAKAVRRLSESTVFIHRSHGFELRVQNELAPWLKLYNHDNRSHLKKLLSHSLGRLLSHNYHSIARYADGHIVSCTQCRDFLIQKLKVPVEHIAVIPQAPLRAFTKEPVAPMTKERLKRILYVSQFAFFKAPMILAGAFNQLSQLDDRLRFTWVCSNEHQSEIKSLLNDKTRARVTLLDWMDQERLMQVFDGHGVFLFPSFFEGFGKAFLEAMSRGLCVIAADNGGARDVIDHGCNGLLVPTGCVESLVRSCMELVGDLRRATRISRDAAVCAQAYSWERVASETLAFYESRVESKARRRAL